MRKADVVDLNTLEVYYGQVRKIKFDDNIRIRSLDDVYNNLFTLQRIGLRQQPTFFMRGALQCDAGRLRSLDDFVNLAKKYFPDKTLKEIFTFLIEKEKHFEEQNMRQSFRYCGHIRKYNYSGLTNLAYTQSIGGYRFTDIFHNLEGFTVLGLIT